MNLCFAGNFEELPKHFKERIRALSPFYSEGYQQYSVQQGNKMIYLYTEMYLMAAIVVQKSFFKYAELPSEPIMAVGEELSIEKQRHFLDACMDVLAKDHGAMWVNHPYTSGRFQATPTEGVRIPYGNRLIDLSQEEELIWKDFDRANRNRVNHGTKVGLEVVFGGIELLKDYFKLDIETRNRSKMALLEEEYFENVLRCMPEEVFIAVVYKEGVPQGAGYFIYSQEICYYMYSATANESESGSINFMVWKVLQYMKEKDVKLFSFVGSRIQVDKDSKHYGIQKFKERFGGYIEECYLFKVIFKPRMHQLYCGSKEVRNRLIGQECAGDIIDQEIHKWMHLNDPEAVKRMVSKLKAFEEEETTNIIQ